MLRTFLPSVRTFLLLASAVLTPLLSAASLPLTQWELAAGGNDHYYQVFFLDANDISWTDAYADAQGRGGYLATIFSAEENEFIKALTLTANGYLESWIGLTDVLDEGVFVWVTGESTIAFDNWAPNEPNNDLAFGGEHYVVMSPPVDIDKNVPGSWNDLPNNSGRVKTWIVEWDLQPPTAVPEPATLWTLLLAAGVFLLFRRP